MPIDMVNEYSNGDDTMPKIKTFKSDRKRSRNSKNRFNSS